MLRDLSGMRSLTSHLSAFLKNPNKQGLVLACWRSVAPAPSDRDITLQRRLEATYNWLCAAQDATPDDGVSGGYSLITGQWSASYPETTGYIIPTFLAYAAARQVPEAKERALRMADWEIQVQLPSGAVRSGQMNTKVGPAVFNTGQVLLGWIAAYQETSDERYGAAATRAAEWLVKEQDEDGAWRRNLSVIATSPVQAYNTRTAWALALAGHTLGKPEWIAAARKNCDWALAQQNERGWFRNNTFYEGEVPLLHTISYVLEGLLGVWSLTKEDRYLDRTKLAVDGLLTRYKKLGKFSGSYDADWSGTVAWRCLTGEAQIAVVLYRLSNHYENGTSYAQTAQRIIEDVAKTQLIESRFGEEACIGAIAGSQPIWGRYHCFSYINWAAKFYLDGLLLSLSNTDERSFPNAI
jgi:uncharacterized protein YyaL (SSP411 family)